jgi:hypothetical protein
MSKYFSKVFLTTLTVLTLSSFALAPVAEARGGGGASRGGGDRQVNNSNRDVRTNDVRSTSVNNVNVNRNVNVNVDNNNGWDNDYHPVARAAAVTAAVAGTAAVVGSVVYSVPSNCVPVNYGGYIYQQCGDTWYQPDGTQYIVVNPPY